MYDQELISKIAANQVLRRVSDNLFAEVSFHAGNSAKFALITILTAISIIVQIIVLCQQQHSQDKLTDWIKTARTLPRFRTARLKRRLDALWQDHCGDDSAECGKNALFAALLDVGENATDEEIAELFRLAGETKVQDNLEAYDD
jgi:hypothetical protein